MTNDPSSKNKIDILISIITSTYNEFAAGLLQQAVYSVLRQTYQNWELIIVGDCAPDAEEINQFLAKIGDKRIKFINLIKRAGTVSPGTIPKIEGVKLAHGDLLCFLDADNLYFPEHLELCVKAFETDPWLDLVYENTLLSLRGACRFGGRRSNLDYGLNKRLLRSLRLLAMTFSFTWKKPDWTPKRAKMLMTSNFLDMSEPVFTRAAYDGAGGLDPSHHAADWLLWKAMIDFGHNNFKHLNHLGLIYHTSSLTHHLQYFMLMMMQKMGLTYHSEKLKWMQERIKKRFIKKHR